MKLNKINLTQEIFHQMSSITSIVFLIIGGQSYILTRDNGHDLETSILTNNAFRASNWDCLVLVVNHFQWIKHAPRWQ
jgi:hypothetical protein